MQRHFLLIGISALFFLGSMLVVSFAGDTGTSSVAVSGGSTNFVYPVSNGASLPSAVNALKYTPSTNINQTTHAITTAVLPSWIPSANTAGSVTTAGDLALFDATGSNVQSALLVNMYVTNLAALQLDYSSYAFPVNVYESPCTAGSCTWTQSSGVVATAPTYLLNAAGVLSFRLPAGKYYVISFDSGGSYYCTSTTASGGSLSPTFYFSAQAN